jgi:hypothetical protein
MPTSKKPNLVAHWYDADGNEHWCQPRSKRTLDRMLKKFHAEAVDHGWFPGGEVRVVRPDLPEVTPRELAEAAAGFWRGRDGLKSSGKPPARSPSAGPR